MESLADDPAVRKWESYRNQGALLWINYEMLLLGFGNTRFPANK